MSFSPSDPEGQLRVAAFEQGLRELGWVEGSNLRIEYRWADNANLLPSHAADLVRLAPDVILTNSTPVTAALKEQTRKISIVFVQVTDPVGQGFAENLARPGGNITGFTNFEFTVGTKWLEALKEIAPHVTRVAVVFNPNTAPFAKLFQAPVEAAAPSFSVTPIHVGPRSTEDLESMIGGLAREPNGGLMVLPDVSTDKPSWPDRCTGGTSSPAGRVPISIVCHERRSALVWSRRVRRFSARSLLCGPSCRF